MTLEILFFVVRHTHEGDLRRLKRVMMLAVAAGDTVTLKVCACVPSDQ